MSSNIPVTTQDYKGPYVTLLERVVCDSVTKYHEGRSAKVSRDIFSKKAAFWYFCLFKHSFPKKN